MNDTLRKENPTERNVAFVNFQPTYVKGFVFREWTLGHVESRPALARDEARIAYRHSYTTSVHPETDLYTLIKLLPFSQKLNFLERCIDHPSAEIIGFAILSDLTNELLAFAHHTWKGEFTDETLSKALNKLNTLCDYDFNKLYKNPDHKYFLINLLLRYEYLAKTLPDKTDKYILPAHKLRTMVSEISLHKITMLLGPLKEESLYISRQRISIQKKWRDVKKEDLYDQFSSSFAPNIKYDNDNKDDEVTHTQQLPFYQKKNSAFQEGLHFFNSNQERTQQAQEKAGACKFDLEKPTKGFGLNRRC